MSLRPASWAVLALSLAAPAHATFVTQHFQLQVNDQIISPVGPTCINSASPQMLLCGGNYIGKVYQGVFTFDDSLLASDGLKEGVPRQGFNFSIDGYTFGSSSSPNEPYNTGILPGLLVQGGQLVAFVGWLHGSGDEAFLSFAPNGSFEGTDTSGLADPGFGVAPRHIFGTMEFIPSVPEPSALMLALLALATSACVGAAARPRATRR